MHILNMCLSSEGTIIENNYFYISINSIFMDCNHIIHFSIETEYLVKKRNRFWKTCMSLFFFFSLSLYFLNWKTLFICLMSFIVLFAYYLHTNLLINKVCVDFVFLQTFTFDSLAHFLLHVFCRDCFLWIFLN